MERHNNNQESLDKIIKNIRSTIDKGHLHSRDNSESDAVLELTEVMPGDSIK